MTRNWSRTPGRRLGAALLATAIATTGIVYVGFHMEDNAAHSSGVHGGHTKTVTEASALAQAARTGKSIEVTAARTSHSSTWARPDGLMTKQLFSSPVRAKVGGEWKKIDPSLHRTKQGWEPKATNTRMVFSGGSKGRDEHRASRSTVRRVSLVKQAAAAEPETPWSRCTSAARASTRYSSPGPALSRRRSSTATVRCIRRSFPVATLC